MTSDSSDDENLDLFREAVDSRFLNDSMFNDKPSASLLKNTERSREEIPPSLRRTQDEDEQFNLFRVTPEFRSYVAKHLSQALENKLKNISGNITDTVNTASKKRRKSSVRLLNNSTKFLKVQKCSQECLSVNNKNEHDLSLTGKHSISRLVRKSSDPIDKAVLKTVAVSPESILSKQETKFWSNRSEALVFQYKKSSDGNLVLVEP